MTTRGFIGMIHHDHEGVWPEQIEPYPVFDTKAEAERWAEGQCDHHSESAISVEVTFETVPPDTSESQ